MYHHSFSCPKCNATGKIDGVICDLCKGDGTFFLVAEDEKKALKAEKKIKKLAKEGNFFL